MASKALAVLAAILLVGAFALATLGPPDIPLGQALMQIDQSLVPDIELGVDRHLSHWFLEHIIVPLMVRPAWLIPACLGLICAGAAATLASSGARHSHRRRS